MVKPKPLVITCTMLDGLRACDDAIGAIQYEFDGCMELTIDNVRKLYNKGYPVDSWANWLVMMTMPDVLPYKVNRAADEYDTRWHRILFRLGAYCQFHGRPLYP